MYAKAKMFQSKVEWEGGHYQGDIDVTDGSEDLPKITYFNAVTKEQLWPDNTMYYYINEKHYDINQINKIEEAAAAIHDATGCIHIYRVNKESKQNYLVIEPSGGCSSFVGMIGGPQRLSLNKSCTFNYGTIIHEFMHALGFHHEHCRGNRNDCVTVNWDNIDEKNWSAFNRADESHSAKYDFDSVMHFGPKAFARDQTKSTLTPEKGNTRIGQRERLSEMDVERIRILYGDLKPADSVHFTSVNSKDVFKPAIWVPKKGDTSKQGPTDLQQSLQ